jgi:adenine-specific DNA-methyltransferase
MQLNAEDTGERKYICVQIPEKTDEKSEAFKANYKNICEIGKERIRRAGEKIKSEMAELAKKAEIAKKTTSEMFANSVHSENAGGGDLDIGFRVLTIDSSNMKDVYFSPSNTNQEDMLDLASNIKEDRTDEDLLFMVLLAWGIDLSSKIERKQIAGKTVYFVDNNYLAACFDKNINEDFVKKLVEHDNSNNLGVRKLLKVVLKDSSFDDSVKINAEQIFKQANIEIKVI